MGVKYRKSYKFAVKSATFISIFNLVLVVSLQCFFFQINIFFTMLFTVLCFVFSFFVLQYRVERFIYQHIQKIYKEVSILDESVLRSQPITTDMQTLMSEVYKFATDKKVEIESLKVQEEYRREFVGNVAHELKTPLFTVQGYVSTLLDGGVKDKTIRKKYLERADKGIERLIDIVNDLDMITKLEANELKLNVQVFDLIDLFQNAFDLLEMKAEKKDITLMFDKDHYRSILVNGDREKINQVVLNLVDNSIKYGKDNGTTEVSIESLTDKKLLVRITDNGYGIDKKHIPRLFERFYRTDASRSRDIGGSGLGLSIVKHIIEAHNEHIYVESKVGVGSEFSFTIDKALKN